MSQEPCPTCGKLREIAITDFVDEHRAVRVGDVLRAFTPSEWEILKLLRAKLGEFVPRAAIHNRLCAGREDGGPGEQIVSVYLSYMRRVLRGSNWQIISRNNLGAALMPAGGSNLHVEIGHNRPDRGRRVI